MFKQILVAFFLVVSFAAKAQDNLIESKKNFGTYQYFQKDGKRLTNKQVLNKVEVNTEAYQLMKSARANNTLAGILSTVGGALIGFQIGTAVGGGEAHWSVAGVGAGLIVAGIPFNTGFNKKSKRAIDLYNAGLNDRNSDLGPDIKFGFIGKGLGIGLNF